MGFSAIGSAFIFVFLEPNFERTSLIACDEGVVVAVQWVGGFSVNCVFETILSWYLFLSSVFHFDVGLQVY